jgi:hypothetical protein
MTGVGHIAAKDIRRLRWLIVGWVAIVAVRTLIATAGADVALAGFGPQVGINEVSQLISIVYVVLLALLMSSLVHDDPLVGREAFWITRPIAPGSLMTAKLAFVAIFCLVVPLTGSVIVAASFGMRAGEIAETIPAFVLNQLIPVTLLMALAVITPSLARYVLAIVGAISAFVIFTASALFVALLWANDIDENGEVPLPDPTPAVVAGTLMVVVASAVIVYQYRRRRVGRALAVAGMGAIVVFVVPDLWTWSLVNSPTPEMAAAPQDTPDLSVSLDGANPRVTDALTLRRRMPARKYIAAHAIVAGVPSEFIIRTVVPRSRLELPGGGVVQTGSRSSATLSVNMGGSTTGRIASVEAALGGVRLLPPNDAAEAAASQQWPTVLKVDEGDFVRYRRDAGRLTADVDLLFERATVRGTLPLADHATLEIGNMHVSVVRVIRRPTGCIVLLRRSYVESLFTQRRYRDIIYVLRNTLRAEAVSGDAVPLFEEGFSTGGWVLTSPHVGGRGFVLEQYELQFPSHRRPDASPVDLDQSWLAGAELVMLETIPAGRIRRSVRLDGFRMTP